MIPLDLPSSARKGTAVARKAIAVFSHKDDLHACLIAKELGNRGAVCHIVETDNQLAAGGLSWSAGGASGARLRTREGAWLEPESLDAVWWRRVRGPQRGLEERIAPAERAFVTAAWRESLYGVLESRFRGRWINHPQCGDRAESKLVQLRVAEQCGLRVPRTLVSQVPEDVRAFLDGLDGRRAVAKKVAGAPGPATQTVVVESAQLTQDALIAACPTIYQEQVPGTRHLRVHLFGQRTVPIAVSTGALDWRVGLPGRYEPCTLERGDEAKLRAFLNGLGLTTAILDLKVDPQGRLWFLEANPQGQFLFMQGLSGVDLVGPMCDCLLAEIPHAWPLSHRGSGWTPDAAAPQQRPSLGADHQGS